MSRHRYKAIVTSLVVLGIVAALAWAPTAESVDAHHTSWHKPKRTTTTTTTATPPTTEPPTTTTTTTVPATTCRSRTVTEAAPINITTGGTYSGYYRSTDPTVPAVRISTTQPVVIDGACIEHAGRGVFAWFDFQADLTIRDTTFQQLDPGGGNQSERAVYAYNATKLVFEHNLLVDGAGVYWAAPDVTPTAGAVRYNKVINIGRYYPHSLNLTFFQTDNVDMAGLEVAWNEIRNTPLQSDVEDLVNFYQSNGSPGAPFDLHHNLFDGGYPTVLGPTGYTGAGTTLGDSGGSYQRARDNWYVGVSNTGPNIPAGDNMEVYNNVVVSDGLANGVPTGPDFGNGISMWDNPAYAQAVTNSSVHDNTVGFLRVNSDSSRVRSDYWLPMSGTGGNTDANNTSMADPIDAADEQAVREAWNKARIAAGVSVGPRPFEPTAIAGLGYNLVFEDQFETLGQTWVEFPWFVARHGNTVENGHLFIRTEPNNPFSVGNEATTLGPRSESFPHYPAAKTWQGPWVYFEARFRYTNNPWTVPAFWLYTAGRANHYPDQDAWCPNTNPEWDIVEGNIVDPGSDALSTQGLHKNTNSYCGIADEVQVEWTPNHGSGLSGWHVWSGWWTDTSLIQYLDDVPQSTMAHNGWLNTPLFMILHIDEGSTTPPGNPAKASQYELEVDWVKVWKKT